MSQFKLIFTVAKLAYKHGNKLIHASNNNDLLVEDLGKALKEQQRILTNKKMHVAFTAYDLLSQLIEVKALTAATGAKLGIKVRGRKDIDILEDIIAAYDTPEKQDHAKDIRDNLEWTRKLFAAPEIQDIMNMEMTGIEKPKSILGLGEFFKQVAYRSKDEVVRVQQFLDRVKKVDIDSNGPKPAGPKA